MNYTEIIDKTYELVEDIKRSEIFLMYIKYKKLVESDKELNKILIKFKSAKEKFAEVYEYRNYYKGFEDIKKDYQKSKIELMNNKLYKNYKLYEKKVESYLNEIEFQLKKVVRIKEKHSKIILR